MTKKLTFAGVGCAISVVILSLTNIFPFNTAFLLCAAAALFSVIKIKCGSGVAFAAVFVSGVLSFILLAEKIYVVTFSLLAVYTVLKGVIENINNLAVEWVLKLAVYFIAAFIMLKIFMPALLVPGIFAGLIVFIIYDFAISVFVGFASRNLKI